MDIATPLGFRASVTPGSSTTAPAFVVYNTAAPELAYGVLARPDPLATHPWEVTSLQPPLRAVAGSGGGQLRLSPATQQLQAHLHLRAEEVLLYAPDQQEPGFTATQLGIGAALQALTDTLDADSDELAEPATSVYQFAIWQGSGAQRVAVGGLALRTESPHPLPAALLVFTTDAPVSAETARSALSGALTHLIPHFEPFVRIAAIVLMGSGASERAAGASDLKLLFTMCGLQLAHDLAGGTPRRPDLTSPPGRDVVDLHTGRTDHTDPTSTEENAE